MKRRFEDYLEEQLQDPELASEYHKIDLAYQVAAQVITLRQLHGLTQAELAEKVNTKQSGISRLENATSTPSLSFLQRIAESLNSHLEVRMIPNGTITAVNGSGSRTLSPKNT